MNIIAKTNIPREKGKLYFIKSDTDGNLMICEAELKRGGVKKNANTSKQNL